MIMPTHKKFSTATRALSAVTLGLLLVLQPSTPTQAQTASSTSRTAEVFTPNAPDRHIVVRGDTLWDLAGKYLRQPWRWPEIWQLNRDQIRNPHWIYPGQVIVLDRRNGTMSISNDTINLVPRIREEAEALAIPSIPPDAIEPFLSQPVVVDNATMIGAPRVIASAERVLLGRGDEIYVSGITDERLSDYQLYRPGTPLRDPDTQEILAYESVYLGTARKVRDGTPATFLITSSRLEINVGDRLVPAPRATSASYVPRAPERDINGRVLSIYGGVQQAGRNQIIAINRGRRDGVENGYVLALQTRGRTITDRTGTSPVQVQLPNERNGLAFVFRVFDRISYALIMNVEGPVSVGDNLIRP